MLWLRDTIVRSKPYRNLGAEVWDGILAADEKLLWSGRPGFGLRLTQMGWGFVGFSAIFLAIIGFIAFQIADGAGLSALPLGVSLTLGLTAFFMVAFSCLFIVLERWLRSLLYYAVTSQRALILNAQGGPPYRVTVIPISPDMKMTLSGGKQRTIWFKNRFRTQVQRPVMTRHTNMKTLLAGVAVNTQARIEMSYDSRKPQTFRFLEDAESVRDLIREVASGNSTA